MHLIGDKTSWVAGISKFHLAFLLLYYLNYANTWVN